MRQINVSTARAELPSLVGSGERIVITRNGQPAAVLLGIDDFRVLRATQDLAGDREAVARVHRVHEQLQRGDHSGLVDLDFAAERPARERYPLPGSSRPSEVELREAVSPPEPPRFGSPVEESLERLSAAMADIATAFQALKEEAVAEARSAAAEEARHAVAEAISR